MNAKVLHEPIGLISVRITKQSLQKSTLYANIYSAEFRPAYDLIMRMWNSLGEQSFAKDTKNTASRSYTCTFCRRMFRSAQALGGHMNIHRRDRANLLRCGQEPDNFIFTAPSPNSPLTKFSISTYKCIAGGEINEGVSHASVVEELDLELRLGR